LGECYAIRSRGFNYSELTFVGIMESDSGASPKPVYRYESEFGRADFSLHEILDASDSLLHCDDFTSSKLNRLSSFSYGLPSTST
jgi:hypothetical protein